MGPPAIYIVTYHWLDREDSGNHAERKECPWLGAGGLPKPVLAEGARALIELLERIGLNFHLREVRGALEDILRLGSANIPDLWFSEEEMFEKGLVEW